MNDQIPEHNEQTTDAAAPAQTNAPLQESVGPAAQPSHNSQQLRWRDLAFVALFYVGVGAALAKLSLMAAAAMAHTSEESLKNIPPVYVGAVAASQALISFAVLGFLWLLIRSQGTAPLWPTLGWHALPAKAARAGQYIVGGAVLALVIQSASYFVGAKSVPMEDFFRDRPSVLMMTALGVLIAPAIEETLFRGCLYPVVARTFGVPAGIIATGVLFGLAHSVQLAGAWPQVLLVTIVGVVLTIIRARTGTVLASFLVHLGYNSFLFGAFYIATRGLQKFPPM